MARTIDTDLGPVTLSRVGTTWRGTLPAGQRGALRAVVIEAQSTPKMGASRRWLGCAEAGDARAVSHERTLREAVRYAVRRVKREARA